MTAPHPDQLIEALDALYAKATHGPLVVSKDLYEYSRDLLAERAEGVREVVARNMPIPDARFHAALVAAYPVLRERLQRAERFVLKMFELSDWPEGGDIDGFAFQDEAIAHGYLRAETRTAPCGESCHCAEYHGDMTEGVTCYRKTLTNAAEPEIALERGLRLQLANDSQNHLDELSRVQERLQRAERALRPFSKFSVGFGRTARADDWVLVTSPSGRRQITMGDVRAAEDVLAHAAALGELHEHKL